MTDWVKAGLERFGQTAVIRSGDGGERPVRAFLQPVIKQGENLPGDVSSAGWVDGRLWRYIGQEALGEDDLLLWQGLTFRVRSCRAVFFRDALCHWQASLEREKEGRPYEGA